MSDNKGLTRYTDLTTRWTALEAVLSRAEQARILADLATLVLPRIPHAHRDIFLRATEQARAWAADRAHTNELRAVSERAAHVCGGLKGDPYHAAIVAVRAIQVATCINLHPEGNEAIPHFVADEWPLLDAFEHVIVATEQVHGSLLAHQREALAAGRADRRAIVR